MCPPNKYFSGADAFYLHGEAFGRSTQPTEWPNTHKVRGKSLRRSCSVCHCALVAHKVDLTRLVLLAMFATIQDAFVATVNPFPRIIFPVHSVSLQCVCNQRQPLSTLLLLSQGCTQTLRAVSIACSYGAARSSTFKVWPTKICSLAPWQTQTEDFNIIQRFLRGLGRGI